MAAVPYKITKGEFGLSLTDPGVPVADAKLSDYSDFSCQQVSAQLTPTQNIDEEEVPATFCSPASTSRIPRSSTYELDLTVLQDPGDDTITGLANFLYTNDSGETGVVAYFYLALAEAAAPKAIGEVWLAPMDFGGESRTVLQADLSLPVEGRPDIEHGNTPDTP